MATIRGLLKELESFNTTPESAGYDLRLDLSTIIHMHLARKGWTQSKLAAACGMKAPLLTRIMHGASNCTFETAGRILFALGVQPKLNGMERSGKSAVRAVKSALKIPKGEESDPTRDLTELRRRKAKGK